VIRRSQEFITNDEEEEEETAELELLFVLYETKSAVQLLATSYKYSIQEAGGTGINTLHLRTHGHCRTDRTCKRRNQQDSVSSIIITIMMMIISRRHKYTV
jgi:hypothetical protein